MSVNIFYCSSYFVVFVLFVFVFYQCAPPLFKKNPHATCMQGKLARISRLTPVLFCSNLCITRNTMDGNNKSRTLIKKHPPPPIKQVIFCTRITLAVLCSLLEGVTFQSRSVLNVWGSQIYKSGMISTVEEGLY